MRAFGGNSGYVGYSESKRSFYAKQEGKLPKTLFKKEWHISEKKFLALVEEGIVECTEWHHTSKFGNRTNFYEIQDKVLFLYKIGEIKESFELYKKEKRAKLNSSMLLKESENRSRSRERFCNIVVIAKEEPILQEFLKYNLFFHRTKHRKDYNFYFGSCKYFFDEQIIREAFLKTKSK